MTSNSGVVYINGIKLSRADIAADNGVIHRISHVLMLPAGNIVIISREK